MANGMVKQLASPRAAPTASDAPAWCWHGGSTKPVNRDPVSVRNSGEAQVLAHVRGAQRGGDVLEQLESGAVRLGRSTDGIADAVHDRRLGQSQQPLELVVVAEVPPSTVRRPQRLRQNFDRLDEIGPCLDKRCKGREVCQSHAEQRRCGSHGAATLSRWSR
jgi:hypothetical protein